MINRAKLNRFRKKLAPRKDRAISGTHVRLEKIYMPSINSIVGESAKLRIDQRTLLPVEFLVIKGWSFRNRFNPENSNFYEKLQLSYSRLAISSPVLSSFEANFRKRGFDTSDFNSEFDDGVSRTVLNNPPRHTADRFSAYLASPTSVIVATRFRYRSVTPR